MCLTYYPVTYVDHARPARSAAGGPSSTPGVERDQRRPRRARRRHRPAVARLLRDGRPSRVDGGPLALRQPRRTCARRSRRGWQSTRRRRSSTSPAAFRIPHAPDRQRRDDPDDRPLPWRADRSSEICSCSGPARAAWPSLRPTWPRCGRGSGRPGRPSAGRGRPAWAGCRESRRPSSASAGKRPDGHGVAHHAPHQLQVVFEHLVLQPLEHLHRRAFGHHRRGVVRVAASLVSMNSGITSRLAIARSSACSTVT